MLDPACELTRRKRWWSRVRLIAGLATFALIYMSMGGTLIAMVRSYNTLADGGEVLSSDEFSRSIAWALKLTMALMPFTVVSTATLFISWLRLRDIRLLESRNERSRER